ncbi:amidohydrolase family protein [Pseudonocardia humida]|uniref:Amidohydrolase family protein n=1 Tax=Pseudonocardia humida TaxID=2800819 RepID=A0ABT1A9Q1_9PSEU|nr:amidohydrolase family protein [Pseudonocardia humida]MCO1659762.1 amidohydrolase family protein [Pseudonocardia humida]
MSTRILSARTVLAGPDLAAIDEGAVVVEGTRIGWVGPLGELPARYAEVPVQEYPGSTILPGLIDTHVHLGFDGGPDPVTRMRGQTDVQLLDVMRTAARTLAATGVTTVCDLGARGFLDLALKKELADRPGTGPRVLSAARPVTTREGHCWFMGGESETGIRDLEELVELHALMGADVIKVMSTGGTMTVTTRPWQAQFSLEGLRALVARAHALGLRVTAHAHGRPGIDNAVRAGVDKLEHCTFLTEERATLHDADLVARIVDQGIHVCPTLNVNSHELMSRRPGAAASIRAMYDAGVRLVAGTDAGIRNLPHDAYAEGLVTFTDLGVPAHEVLLMATVRAAESLGVADRVGTLAPGMAADLVVAPGDPTADVAVLRTVQRVVVDGADVVGSDVLTHRSPQPQPAAVMA